MQASFSNLIMYLKSVVSHVSGRLKAAWASRVSYELLRDEEKAIADCRKKDSVIEERYGNINRDNEVELVKRHCNGKQRGPENQTKKWTRKAAPRFAGRLPRAYGRSHDIG